MDEVARNLRQDVVITGEQVEALVKRQVAMMVEAAATLTTRCPFPGTSARTHNDICRSGRVVGAIKIGRQWVCSRDAWVTARTSTPVKRAVTPADIAAADRFIQAAAVKRGSR